MASGIEAKASAGYLSPIRGLYESRSWRTITYNQRRQTVLAQLSRSRKTHTHTQRQAHMHIHKCKWCVKAKEKRRQFEKNKELKDTKQRGRVQEVAGSGIADWSQDRKPFEGGRGPNFDSRMTLFR